MDEAELIRGCLHGLRAALPGGITAETRLGGGRPEAPDVDGWLCLRGHGGVVDIPYEAKVHVGEANVALVDRRMRDAGREGRTGTPPWILFTRFVHGKQARRLREAGIAFADTEGNAHVWGPGLYVWVTGNRPEAGATRTPRLTRAAAARVLFVLLQDPRRVREPYRNLAAQAGVALDTVHRVFDDLQTKGYLRTGEGRARVLGRLPLLHELWITAYEDALRPKLLPTRCRRLVGGPLGDVGLPLADAANAAPWLIGGEAAAADLTEALRPTTATLHTLPGEQRAVMKALGLVPAPEGPITLLHTFGTTNEWRPTEPGPAHHADPLLIHAELLRIGDDRAKETAARLYERHIRVRFGDAP